MLAHRFFLIEGLFTFQKQEIIRSQCVNVSYFFLELWLVVQSVVLQLQWCRTFIYLNVQSYRNSTPEGNFVTSVTKLQT